jgi:hypothetical protein
VHLFICVLCKVLYNKPGNLRKHFQEFHKLLWQISGNQEGDYVNPDLEAQINNLGWFVTASEVGGGLVGPSLGLWDSTLFASEQR